MLLMLMGVILSLVDALIPEKMSLFPSSPWVKVGTIIIMSSPGTTKQLNWANTR